jgi:hypothetical protein
VQASLLVRIHSFLSNCNTDTRTEQMKKWARRLHTYYEEVSEKIHAQQAELVRNFPGCVFAAATANLGDYTMTKFHTDNANKAEGLCGIWALGKFDYKKGGHLVIPAAKLIIEFPPGSLILIPSSILKHGNTRLSPVDRRMSLTFYSAGGLFRWVDYGFRTSKSVEASSTAKDQALVREMKIRAPTAYRDALARWSTAEELGLRCTM